MSEGVTIFQRHLAAVQAERVAKQTQDASTQVVIMKNLAHDAMWEEMAKRVRLGKARDEAEAYGQLITERHPLYQAYFKHLEAAAPPPSAETIAKREEEAAIRKRVQVLSTIEKRADELVTAGRAKDRGEAFSQIFKNDRDLYDEYRKASYTTDRPPQPPRDGMQSAPEAGPAYLRAQRLARDLKQSDVYGQYTGRSEAEMMSEVFSMHPEIYEQHRRETLDR